MNTTTFKASVVSLTKAGTPDVLAENAGVYHPETLQGTMKDLQSILAIGRSLIDETSRKLVIEIEFDTDRNRIASVKDVFDSLRYRVFNFDFKMPVVTHCEIQTPSRLGERAKVNVIFNDGTAKTVVEYFDDELSFSTSEFIGLTEDMCRQRFTERDAAYLRS